MACAPFGVHVRHPVQSSRSPLAATDSGLVLEEVPIRQPSHALHQEQPAAGGAICMHETELSDGPPTYRKTIGVYWACPAPSHLNLHSRLVKLNIWFLFIWLQNLKEDSLISQHSKNPSSTTEGDGGREDDLRMGGLPCGTHVVRPINKMDQRLVAQPFN